jgi:hypothetical protein
MFVAGTEPTRLCGLHAGGLKGLFQRFFKKGDAGKGPVTTND